MAAPQITDRAHRYRAQKLAPAGRKVCAYCGSTRFLVPDHIDGVPDHTTRSNLQWLCKSCNTAKGAAFAKAGRGRLTNQYNPASGEVPTLKQYSWAVANHQDGAHDEGGAIIHATPPDVRSEYARAMAGKSKRTKRERADERWNPLFGGQDARQTTPATGGIAHHTRGAIGKAHSSTRYRGYTISRTEDGEFFSSLDPASWFSTKAAAQSHIDRYLKGRGNPAAASAEVFEDFHGYAPKEVVTVTKKVHHHENLAGLGELIELHVLAVDGHGHTISRFKKAILCSNEDRSQLFIEGGDQRLDLANYGIRHPHEMETIGQVDRIVYFTTKTHLGDEGGTAAYVHKMRTTNQNGRHVTIKPARYPDLIYDVRNEQLLFSGGSYEILREGINK